MKALVTGGGGFLGGAVCKILIGRGDEVKSLARGEYPHLASLGVVHVRGDIADYDTVRTAVAGCDAVFHTAAKAGIWGPLAEYRRANVTGAQNVIRACREAGVGRLIYTSSPSVTFAGQDQMGVDESEPYPDRFKAHYPATKAEAEQMALAANDENLAVTALRPHLIWGPGDPHIVPRLVQKARVGRLMKLKGGPYVIDSTYIDNAAEAHVQACDRLSPGSPPAGQAYYISNGEPMDIAELVDRIIGAAGLPPVQNAVSPKTAYAAGAVMEALWSLFHIKKEPPMTRFVARQMATAHWFDLSAARRDIGYEPKVTIEEGLRRLGQWLEERPF